MWQRFKSDLSFLNSPKDTIKGFIIYGLFETLVIQPFIFNSVKAFNINEDLILTDQ